MDNSENKTNENALIVSEEDHISNELPIRA
jgi:hypothetical protein